VLVSYCDSIVHSVRFYDCKNISGFALVNTVGSGLLSKFVVNACNV